MILTDHRDNSARSLCTSWRSVAAWFTGPAPFPAFMLFATAFAANSLASFAASGKVDPNARNDVKDAE